MKIASCSPVSTDCEIINVLEAIYVCLLEVIYFLHYQQTDLYCANFNLQDFHSTRFSHGIALCVLQSVWGNALHFQLIKRRINTACDGLRSFVFVFFSLSAPVILFSFEHWSEERTVLGGWIENRSTKDSKNRTASLSSVLSETKIVRLMSVIVRVGIAWGLNVGVVSILGLVTTRHSLPWRERFKKD